MAKRRVGKITLEQAKKRFNEYYDKRNKTVAGRRRAKLMDMMYQKKDSKVLVPNEPGSEKYMLEEGPRTFDMVGVDYFPEGESFEMETTQGIISGVSRGASYHKSDVDPEDDELSTPDNKGRRKSKKVYGPRIKKNNELYSNRFKRDLKERMDKGSLKGNLVDKYWQDYKKGLHKRKNRKTKNLPVSAKYFEGRQWKLIEVSEKDFELNGFYAVDFDTLDVFRKVQNFVYDEDDKYIKIGNLNDEKNPVSEEIYDILVNPTYGKLKDDLGTEEDSCVCFFIQGENPNITYYTYDDFPITNNSQIYYLDAKGQDVVESGEDFFERLTNKTGKSVDRINNDIVITECEDDNHCLSRPDLESESDSENSPEQDLPDTASQKSSDEQETEASPEVKTQDDKKEKEDIEEQVESSSEDKPKEENVEQEKEEEKHIEEQQVELSSEEKPKEEEEEEKEKEKDIEEEQVESSSEEKPKEEEEEEKKEEKVVETSPEDKTKEERKDKTTLPPEDKSTEQKKESPLIKELFEDTSLASDAEPFSPKSTTSSVSDSKAEQLSKKVDKELTRYLYDKEDDIQYTIALDEINEKANKKINIDKSTLYNILDTLHDDKEEIFTKNNIRFAHLSFLKNLIENI